ncbi:MAG: hypothetical protein M1335_07480 [Chloroflexi bacterium]|nr:hypothetical protein [Chloroflexota bacterium]
MSSKNTSKPNGKPFGVHELRDVEVFRRATAQPKALGAPEGNDNSLLHGVYANRFLSEEERVLFNALVAKLRADFKFNESSDFIQVELVAIYFLKLGRAQETGDWETAQKIDQMLRCHLKDLKATKIAREGDEPQGPETTPAEWASALLRRWDESQKSKRTRSRKNAKTASGNTAKG